MLIVIQNDTDHTQAKSLLEKLMTSDNPDDRARMVAQARLIEAYERARWPRRVAPVADVLAYLLDQRALTARLLRADK